MVRGIIIFYSSHTLARSIFTFAVLVPVLSIITAIYYEYKFGMLSLVSSEKGSNRFFSIKDHKKAYFNSTLLLLLAVPFRGVILWLVCICVFLIAVLGTCSSIGDGELFIECGKFLFHPIKTLKENGIVESYTDSKG